MSTITNIPVVPLAGSTLVRAFLSLLALVTRWLKVPPRDALKLFATAIEALRRNGVTEAENHLVLIRGWQTSTLLVKATAFSGQELAAVKAFCRRRYFDTAYYPGMTALDANRYNRLREPAFFNGAVALLAGEKNKTR